MNKSKSSTQQRVAKSAPGSVVFQVFTKADGPLTKVLSLVDGKVQASGAECRMT